MRRNRVAEKASAGRRQRRDGRAAATGPRAAHGLLTSDPTHVRNQWSRKDRAASSGSPPSASRAPAGRDGASCGQLTPLPAGTRRRRPLAPGRAASRTAHPHAELVKFLVPRAICGQRRSGRGERVPSRQGPHSGSQRGSHPSPVPMRVSQGSAAPGSLGRPPSARHSAPFERVAGRRAL